MRIKNFIVNNLRESVKKIKAELGENAVIIKSEPLPDGRYKIIAAAEPQSGRSRIANRQYKPKQTAGAETTYSNLTGKSNTKTSPNIVNFPNGDPANINGSRISMLPEILKQALYKLNNSGLSIENSLEFVRKHCPGWEKHSNPTDLLLESITRHVDTIQEIPDGAHFFFGYPGEGKTSMIMKAAHALRETGNPLAILNLDHTKIGAGDDLEKFSEWSGFPFLNIDNLEELKKLRKNGVICLVDTPGNLTYEMMVSEPFRNGFVHLVCDVSRELPGLLWQQMKAGKNYLALTKLDYLEQPGKILEKYMQLGRTLSFFSDGPKIPNDFGVFDGDILANLIIDNKNQGNKGNPVKSWMNRLQEIRKSS